MSHYPYLIVGAGAAGIAAGRALAAAGRDFLILEARQRVGGRAHTVLADGHPVDLGCEWLHSGDRNLLAPLARRLGFGIIEKLPDWGARLVRSGSASDAVEGWQQARAALYAAEEVAAAEPADRAVAALLPPGGRWNNLLQTVSGWANGVELDRLSVRDHANYDDSGVNWRLSEGYGRLFERLAEGLPIRLAMPVRAIDLRGRDIVVETLSGRITTEKLLLTLPTALLAGGAVRFTPELPAAKLDAAAGLPLGLANKLFLGVEGPAADLPVDAHLVGRLDSAVTAGYELRPQGRPLVSVYFGGALARELEKSGTAAMVEFAREELARPLGPALARRLKLLAASAWASDPWAEGSYSYALPGHAGDRAILAEPIEDRLFFAGEACSPSFFSTAHGAYESGAATARRMMATGKSLKPEVDP